MITLISAVDVLCKYCAMAWQMKATSRITLRPLVDTLPCMGAVTITLLDVPYFDFALHLFSAFDLMVLPGIHEAAVFAIQSVRAPPHPSITPNMQ